jgi:protoporphyrinogen oxidase
MRIGIIGAGFTGLTAGMRLASQGNNVEIFEASDSAGGLATGFSLASWDWSVERFYHHIFANDKAIIKLAKEVSHPPIFSDPTTAIYFNNKIYPFDSPLHLLKFPHLSIVNKLRMGGVLGFLKLNPFWKPFERWLAHEFLRKSIGDEGYKIIWEPLLNAKFGSWYKEVNAAWFWARIKKRTPRLGYFQGGFQSFADKLQEVIEAKGGVFHLNIPVKSINKQGKHLEITSKLGRSRYDRVLITANNSVFLKIVKDMPDNYRDNLMNLKSLDALVVVVVCKKQILDGIYWLNITDQQLPFVIMVEHTNMIDPKYYGQNHIIYLGTYLQPGHKYFNLSDSDISSLAENQLQKINKSFDVREVSKTFVFRARGVQPLVGIDYSLIRPTIRTPVKNLFLGNLNLVYPWDRGTNYAVDLGEKAAEIIKND